MEKKNENNLLKILSELVSIPSYGQVGGNHPIIEYLKESFANCCEIATLEDSGGNTHLLVGVNRDLNNIENCILLSGHIDTVPETEGHTCNISLVSDVISGLGTSDMKAFIATIISNMDNLKSFDIPIILSITSDEETHLKGINRIITEMKSRNISPNFAIIGEPTNLDYYVSSRGNSIYVDIMKGITCHSGTPELGVNAIELMSEFVMEIKNISKQYENDASICITSINGGKTPSNVVPDECSICFGIRTSNSKVLNTVYNYLANKHDEISKCYEGAQLFNVVDIPPFERRENPFIFEQSSKYNKNIIDARYATEAGYFQVAYPNCNVVIYGPGDPKNIHKAGESININNLYQYKVELIDIISNYLNYNKQNGDQGKCLTYSFKK